MSPRRNLHFLFFLAGLQALGSVLSAEEISGKEYSEALHALSRAAKDVDPDAFLSALETVLKGNDGRSVTSAVSSYSLFATAALKKLSLRDFLSVHGKAAAAFRVVSRKPAADEFRRLLSKNKEWPGRLLLLDASAFCKEIKLQESCLTALEDTSSIVIRRALQYLARSKEVPVVEAVVRRYLELELKNGKQLAAGERDRALLLFQSALHEILKLDLPSARDYKSYFEAHKADPNLFDPGRAQKKVATLLNLFGAPVTGKNLIFVLDISGSMLTTDPWPEGEADPDRGTTVVVDPSKPAPPPRLPSKRQRMYRAKTELSNVIRSLGEDIRFNVITYSSEVDSWKKTMVRATDLNKKSALEYVQGLKAQGTTFTDEAIEAAFSDLDVDTIYLITDGAPTHMGVQTRSLPEDAPALIKEIEERVEELNFLRGVRIFTLGFEGAEENFLKKLAADNSGSYVRIR